MDDDQLYPVTCEWHYGTYSGKVTVQARRSDGYQTIFNRAWGKLKPHMSLAMASRSIKIVEDKRP